MEEGVISGISSFFGSENDSLKKTLSAGDL